jgi:hypothetical protein
MSAYSEGRRQANVPLRDARLPQDARERLRWYYGRRDAQTDAQRLLASIALGWGERKQLPKGGGKELSATTQD